MKSASYILLLLLTLSFPLFAQTDKEERKELQEEKKAANRDKVDYNVFRRQILALPEYSEQRKKAPALQKLAKSPVKIVAAVDSLNDDDEKKLTGYIRQDVGDNSANIYEVIFDRVTKKIVSVKATGESNDEAIEEKAPAKKTPATHPAKKKKPGDDDDEEEEEKPVNKKSTDDDD